MLIVPPTPDRQHHVFAYGSLVEPGCLEGVLGHAHDGERLRARLLDFERRSVPSYAYPFIVDAPGRWVDGVVLMDLSACDVLALDRYEEVEDDVYRRQLVEIEAWGCGPRPWHVAAFTYVAGPILRRA